MQCRKTTGELKVLPSELTNTTLLKVEQEITTFARGVSPVVLCSVGHILFAVCAERSRDNNLRFLRKCHPDKIWNTLITITYLHR